ncbi:MAG: hypothetical protein IKN12_01170 [Selenomonadaceae bacterium]|nr:hypothetical protein [Selenomonadaceae bacterium]
MGLFTDFEISEIDDNNIGEWVAYGALTRPTVMRQRGGSYFSVIAYTPYKKGVPLKFPEFMRGWMITAEHQYYPAVNGRAAYSMDYLIILWNPFMSGNKTKVENIIKFDGQKFKITSKNDIDYFMYVVNAVYEELSKVTSAQILEYQNLLNFISFSLTLGDDSIVMPKVPIYLDYLLTQNNVFKFGNNSIHINNKNVYVISLRDILDSNLYYSMFENIPFRHVRRLICFNQKEAAEEIKTYTKSWCSSRKSMKQYLMQNIMGEVNGYYHEGLYFHLDKIHADFPEYLHENLDSMGIFYCIESFNLKDIWWGSLPGNFLANIVPPVTGFSSVEELLHHHVVKDVLEEKKQFNAELIASLKSKKVSDGVSSGATFETEEELQKQKEGLEYV